MAASKDQNIPRERRVILGNSGATQEGSVYSEAKRMDGNLCQRYGGASYYNTQRGKTMQR